MISASKATLNQNSHPVRKMLMKLTPDWTIATNHGLPEGYRLSGNDKLEKIQIYLKSLNIIILGPSIFDHINQLILLIDDF